MYLDTYVQWSHLFNFAWGMQFVSVIVSIIFCFLLSIYFPPEEIFCSRVTGAYPVTTDCIVAMTSCENKRNGLTVRGLIISRHTSKVFVARLLLLLLCAYSRDSIVWLSYANDLGQAALGAGREAGRPCMLATIVIRTSMYGLHDMTALLLCCCCCCGCHRPSHAPNTPGS